MLCVILEKLSLWINKPVGHVHNIPGVNFILISHLPCNQHAGRCQCLKFVRWDAFLIKLNFLRNGRSFLLENFPAEALCSNILMHVRSLEIERWAWSLKATLGALHNLRYIITTEFYQKFEYWTICFRVRRHFILIEGWNTMSELYDLISYSL